MRPTRRTAHLTGDGAQPSACYTQRVQRLTRDTILRALTALAERLPTDRTHSLVVIGGAAIVLLYGARDSTKDVDAIFLEPEGAKAIRQGAKDVAALIGLPEDWLNDGAKGYVHGMALGERLLTAPSLTVHTLAPQQLLAMKLSAWRDDVDIEDARLLLSKLAGSREETWRRIEPHLVPGRELKAQYAFEDLWEAAHGVA